MSEYQEPMFVEVKFTASVLVPATDLGDTWTVVMRGKVDTVQERLKDGEVYTIAKVKADRAMRVEMDGVIDAANEQLMAQVTSFLEAADYAAETEPKAKPEVPGQSNLDGLDGWDPDTGEKLDPDD